MSIAHGILNSALPCRREYNRKWMRKYRHKLRLRRLRDQGKCLKCEMFLCSEYHKKFPC